MATVNCPKCDAVIADSEENCPNCKVNIKDFLKFTEELDAANEYRRRKGLPAMTKLPKVVEPTSSTSVRKPSRLHSLSSFLRRK